MKLLRKTIRKILSEDACASTTNSNILKGIAELERLGFHIRSYYSPEEYDSGVANSIGLFVFDDRGKQKATWMGEYQVTGEHCLGAFQCTNTSSGNLRGTGVGALLYDVACELAGENGLSSDRNAVSGSAWKMWKYMWKNSSVGDTYQKAGTYDWDGEQTPDYDWDDCAGSSWEDHPNFGRPVGEHPLNQVYVKRDKSRPTIACLEERGLIKYED